MTDHSETETALLELARSLVGELAGGKLLELMLAANGAAKPEPSSPGRDLAHVRWNTRSDVNGWKVQRTLHHPDSPAVIYDLGGGHFSEHAKGQSPGQVLKSPQFTPENMHAAGWRDDDELAGEQQDAEADAAGSEGAEPTPKPSAAGSSSGVRTPTRLSAGDRLKAAQDGQDAVAKAMTDGTPTDEQGTAEGSGEIWDGDRAEQHNEIVRNHLDASRTVPSQGRAIILGGMGPDRAAGLAKAGAYNPDRYATVAIPEILEEMQKAGLIPEVSGVHPKWASPLAQQEAAHIASLITGGLVAGRKNVVLDGSMHDPDQVRQRVSQLRHSGYGEVRGVHVSTPVDKAVDRHRANGTPALAVLAHAGSHGTDTTQQGFKDAQPAFDGWEQWEHSGDTPTRQKRGGKSPRQSDVPASAEDVVAGLGR